MKRICLIALIGLLTPAVAAWAEHPRYDQMTRVKGLAHQLEDAAHHVHESAERTAHHGTRTERHALRVLHQLDHRARHFHRQVERYYQDPYHTEADFRRLVEAYDQARYRIRSLHGFEHVWDDFHRVQYLMEDLLGYYGGYGSRHHGGYDDDHRGYGSRHHGGYDDHRRGYHRRYLPWWRD